MKDGSWPMGDILTSCWSSSGRLPPRLPIDRFMQRPVGSAGRLRMLKQLEQALLNARIEAMLRFGETYASAGLACPDLKVTRHHRAIFGRQIWR
jgi:hypothetical protein